MSEPDHHCPGCGKLIPYFARYPWYFCQGCLATATDGDGRALEFTQEGPAGGFAWRRKGEEDWHEAGSVACLIKGRPVIVGEAMFGGVLAEPLHTGPFEYRAHNLVDLRC